MTGKYLPDAGLLHITPEQAESSAPGEEKAAIFLQLLHPETWLFCSWQGFGHREKVGSRTDPG